MASTFRAALRQNANTAVQNTEAATMAAFCVNELEFIVGTIDPEKVWEAAQRKGMLTRDLRQLAEKNPRAVVELQWA